MTRFDDPPRRALRSGMDLAGYSARSLSLRIGRNATWVQQYLERGTPRRLPEVDRRHIAIALDMDERQLGARDPWTPPHAA